MTDAAYSLEIEGLVSYKHKLEEIVNLAIRMREAQKRYFRTRTRSDLVAAKNLEVEFDQAAGADRGGSGEA